MFSKTFLLALALHLCNSELQCVPTDDCNCFSGLEFEFGCPKDYTSKGGFYMQVTENNDILIDCTGPLHGYYLPNITIYEIGLLKMNRCPLPADIRFIDIIQRLSATTIQQLIFEDTNSTSISKKYFEGLTLLEGLSLRSNNFNNLKEDLLDHTPNLLEIELHGNNISALPANFFSLTVHLNSIILSQNNLVTLPRGLFRNLANLQMLFLLGNKLKSIHSYTFKGLSALCVLELSSNKIESIAEDAFAVLPNLVIINLENNNLRTIHSNTFKCNSKLETVVLKNNPILNLPNYMFANAEHLETVDLSGCGLEFLPSEIFGNSTKLTNVKLSYNMLKNLSTQLLNDLINLKELHLDNNQIIKVGNNFPKLHNLEKLYLQNNLIEEVDRVFEDLINLKVVDLSGNHYSMANIVSLFEKNTNLQEINLSNNSIVDAEDISILIQNTNLRQVDLSYNRIEVLSVWTFLAITNNLHINLNNNNISNVEFSEELASEFETDTNSVSTVISLENNPIKCDCTNYNLWRYFHGQMDPFTKLFELYGMRCANSSALSGMEVEIIRGNLFTCTIEDSRCPSPCSCMWRPLDRSFLVDCSEKSLIQAPKIYPFLPNSQTEINLKGNQLVNIPSPESIEQAMVSKMILSKNLIENITWFPASLKVLKVDYNRIESLDHSTLVRLNNSQLVELTLSFNPWKCDCKSQNFTKYLRYNQMIDSSHIICASSNMKLIELNSSDVCEDWQMFLPYIILIIILLLSIILVVLFYQYNHEVKVWLFSRNMFLWWVSEDELDKDKLYDAFVSYSHKDHDFVVSQLLANLESPPKPYKLCLHFRNWIPGEYITKQVVNSVEESRRTIVILSPDFLKSVWGKMEFRTAHEQAISEGRARIIMVLYGDVDVGALDDELKAYLRTNTYIKWGDPYFWAKMRYALPHSRLTITEECV